MPASDLFLIHASWETVVSLLTFYGMKVVGAILMLIIGYLAAGWIGSLVTRATARSRKLDPSLKPFPGKIVRIAILIFTLLSVLKKFGFETTSLVALIGAAGLAIGLALQGTLTNVASGVLLLTFRPFKIGDAVDINGSVFIMDEIGLFVTRAHLPDGPTVTLPNSKIWGNVITNLSVTHNDQRRIVENYGISYADDIGKAIKLVTGALDADPRILKEPAYRVAIGKLNASSVDILVHAWTKRSDWLNTKLDLNRVIKETFERHGITIPFPQQTVHLMRKNPLSTP